MNGMKMKKCFGKTHSVVKLLLILWMTSLIHIAVGDFFPCSGSNINVSMTLVCDGYYDCDNYEDESLCNYSATFLEEGESHFIFLPTTTTTRLYNAVVLQTNTTNGFRIVFQSFYLSYDVEVQIGTANDPSGIQSIITTIHGEIDYAPDDVYVDTNEMWFAVIGSKSNTLLDIDVVIISIDLSTSFACSSTNMSVSPTVLCDGLYHCDHYEDELACNYSATYLEEGESHFISLQRIETIRLYNTTLLQTNAKYGFRIVFKYLNLLEYDDEVKIGKGDDPSDMQSVITTIHGHINYAHDDVYVDTNEMWLAVIGAKRNSNLRMDVEIISTDLSTSFACSSSNMSVSPTDLCDGIYQCDHYEDESACNYSAIYLKEGKTHSISFSRTYTTRLYNASIIQTNATNGFRVVFRYMYLRYYDDKVQIGTGSDPSDVQSVITTIHGYVNYALDDVYVGTNEMWFTTIGGKGYSVLEIDVEIISIDVSALFVCSSSNMSVSSTLLCDGLYHCDHYEDDSACNNSAIYLDEGESHFISLPRTCTTRLYKTSILQTNATNGFRVVFRYLYLRYYDDKVQIGTGNDTSDSDEQSVITTIHGYVNYAPGDVYVGTTEMWLAAIGGKRNSILEMDVEIISIDLSTLFACSSSNMSVSPTVLCDGLYHCEHYEDELACNYSATYLEEGESHFIFLPPAYTTRLYNTTLLQTYATNGFRVVFRDLYLYVDDEIQIGTGNDPTDEQSVITIIHGYTNYAPDDVYVDTNEMWFTAIGAKFNTRLEMDVEIISIDLSTLLTCSSPKRIMPLTVLCDGLYQCDNYEDELACNNSATYLQKSKSHFIYIPFSTTSRWYNTTFLQTNATYGFRIVFRDFFLYYYDEVQIGTGNDPSDNQSVITTIHGYTNYAPDDVYVRNNEMWFAVIGAKYNTRLGMDVEIISIDLSTICQNVSWISPRFEKVEFPVGENGTWANSTGMCPFNTTQANEPIGRALCIGDGITQSQWQPVDNCGPFRNVTDILTEIAQVIVGEENAGEVSQQVSSVTSNIEDITSDDIIFVAEITSNIVQQNLTSEEVTKSITSIVSNIAQVETEKLEAAEEEGGAISKFVQAFEEQISRVEVADGRMLNIQQPNVAVQVQSVPADDVMRGLVLSLAGSSLVDLTKANITINAPTQDDRDDVIATRADIIAQANIPPSVASVISSTAPLSGSPSNGSGEYVRVTFNVFSTPALFISKSLRTFSAENEGFNRSANSPVISLSIGQGKVAALTEFINFTFTTITSGYVNPNCSFWDEDQEDWSQDGCVHLSGITSSDERYDEETVRCSCDHLTNFAVVMDIHRQEVSLVEAYNILTYIGCCISIFSLLVTLATYLWNKDLRTKQSNQIFICLCLTLLCLYTTFVIVISLDYREVQAGPCGFLTALLHFFVLSSIAWMGVEGYNTYLIIVKNFNTYIQNFMIKAFLAAWGIPALSVVLTGAIARDSYAYDDLCFLQFWAQIGGLLIPMSIILLINIVIFILVVRQLLRSANIAGRVNTIERVQNAICILLLLGLTLVTGYLLLIPLFSQVAQPIFVALNSFLGLFIFLLYCIRKPLIRKKWGLTCFDKFLKKDTEIVTVSLLLDASVTNATKRDDGVSSTTDADTVSVILN